MSKPFSIQSPENIAMEYGGNKQKIAQAMQLGVVDPTAGVLAGMFIDRMRSAQMQEQAPQSTVAQQVMGGVPPVPPTAPSGGLGATPQAAPPMAPPQMGTPPEAAMAPPQGEMMAPAQEAMPEEAPMGMAEGGIVGIDIPDTMFDESSNGGFDDGYAGGGLVAFAGGSPGRRMTDEEYLNYIIKRESGGRDYDKKGRPLTSKAGAKYAMQVRDDTARKPGYGIAPAKADTPDEYNRVGREYALALRKLYGDEGGAAAYNMGPGAYEAYKAGKREMPKETQNYIAGLGGGLGSAPRMAALSDAEVPDILALAARNRQALSDNMSPETKRRQELIAEIEAGLAPEAQKKLSDQSKWEALAQFGFNLAGGQSPNFLQGLGQAAAETLPALAKARSEQKAASRADRQALATLEKMSNEEKQQMEQLALELAKAQAGLLSDERKMDLQMAIAQMDDNTRKALGYMTTYADVWGKSFSERRADYRAGVAANAKTSSNSNWPGAPSATGDGGQSTVTNVGGWND